jgi:hypothetical protein
VRKNNAAAAGAYVTGTHAAIHSRQNYLANDAAVTHPLLSLSAHGPRLAARVPVSNRSSMRFRSSHTTRYTSDAAAYDSVTHTPSGQRMSALSDSWS